MNTTHFFLYYYEVASAIFFRHQKLQIDYYYAFHDYVYQNNRSTIQWKKFHQSISLFNRWSVCTCFLSIDLVRTKIVIEDENLIPQLDALKNFHLNLVGLKKIEKYSDFYARDQYYGSEKKCNDQEWLYRPVKGSEKSFRLIAPIGLKCGFSI